MVPVQVPTSYFPLCGSCSGSGSGSSHNFNKNFKNKISLTRNSVETVRKQADFNLELFILFFFTDFF
jgi:hypothetical protein